MADLSDRIELEIKNISANHGTTTPRIEIEVSATPGNNNILLHDASSELKFRFPDSNKHIDGPIPQATAPRKSEIARNGSKFKIMVELSPQELDEIENRREGGDIEFELSVWLVGERNNDREEARFDISEELIDGEWVRILEKFGYHDKRQIQLDLAINNPRIRDQLDAAHAQIQSAQEKHDTGDYPAAVTECRRAVETLRSIEEIENFVHERKHSDLDDIMGTFESQFTGGLAHSEEKTNITTARRRDSEFALNLTKACAKYISSALDEAN